MRNHRTLTAALLAAALAVCGGCSDEPGTGTMTVSLMDAPFPFDMIAAADLGVDGVEVHVSASGEGASGFYTVSDSADVVNLLELSNGVTEFLGQADLPVGQLKQMRLLVTSASVELKDGRIFDLNVPSGEASGLKVFFDPPIEIVEEEVTDVLIDVDVSRSFSSQPASPSKVEDITGFRFHPVLRVAVSAATGSLSGRVTASPNDSPIAAATVSIWEDGAAVTSTATNVNGEWMILGLEPGTRIVRAEATGFASGQVTATVVAGERTEGVDLALEALP
jgi:hypothetical protein